MTVPELAARVKAASAILALAQTNQKNAALLGAADKLTARMEEILAANEPDMANATLGKVLLDRLKLTPARVESMAAGLREVAAAADPIGRLEEEVLRPNGLRIGKRRVPLGAIGMIVESRPNVAIDAAALCVKSGNAVLLRGGKEAIHSNTVLAGIFREALSEAGLPPDALCLVGDTSRDSAVAMMGLSGVLDVLIPRGNAGLIRAVRENAKIPVIETGIGICHVYVDESADEAMTLAVVENAKCSRPSVCNAAETLLVHKDSLPLLPKLAANLQKYPVEFRACPEAYPLLGDHAIMANVGDFHTEHLDFILNVKVVSGLEEAVAHIAAHGSGHSEAIITPHYANARRFIDAVDAAAVYVNASTRFTDGGEFGLGAEIGISTQKLHARGPLGLAALTAVKYVITGDGQVR
jgi:glutamate-5-semialdehyde dehydrogenase